MNFEHRILMKLTLINTSGYTHDKNKACISRQLISYHIVMLPEEWLSKQKVSLYQTTPKDPFMDGLPL